MEGNTVFMIFKTQYDKDIMQSKLKSQQAFSKKLILKYLYKLQVIHNIQNNSDKEQSWKTHYLISNLTVKDTKTL